MWYNCKGSTVSFNNIRNYIVRDFSIIILSWIILHNNTSYLCMAINTIFQNNPLLLSYCLQLHDLCYNRLHPITFTRLYVAPFTGLLALSYMNYSAEKVIAFYIKLRFIILAGFNWWFLQGPNSGKQSKKGKYHSYRGKVGKN